MQLEDSSKKIIEVVKIEYYNDIVKKVRLQMEAKFFLSLIKITKQ